MTKSWALGACLLVVISVGCSPTKAQPKLLGEACSPSLEDSEECADRLCAALDSASGFCTRACKDSASCGDGFQCETAGKFGRVCVKIAGCQTEQDCPAGHTCNAETGHCYVKAVRTLCSPCTDVLQCPAGGTCYTALSTGEQFCTAPCGADDSCPLGFQCADSKQCLPVAETCNAGKGLCAPCQGDSECGGAFDLCVRNVVSGEMFCGKDCLPDHDDCPKGFSCQNLSGASAEHGSSAGDGPFQCVPVSNSCVDYCQPTTELGQAGQCGLGKTCNTTNSKCQAATDGRQCATCTNHDDCRSGPFKENRCIINDCPDCEFRGEAFCATPCLNDAACVQSFGVGFVCRPAQDGTSTRTYCMPQRGTCASGLGHLGDDCSARGAQDCITGVCLSAGTHAQCSLSCATDADCGDNRYHCCEYDENGYDCSESRRSGQGPAHGPGVCAPLGGLFGDDCSPGRPPCQTGTCLDLGTTRVCTTPCAAGCPDGFGCRDATLVGQNQSLPVCFPSGGGLPGARCDFGPAACQTGLCIRKTSGALCTNACTTDSECPADWTCKDLETVDKQMMKACLPTALQ